MKRSYRLLVIRSAVLVASFLTNGCAQLDQHQAGPARAPEITPAGLQVTMPARVDPATLPSLMVTGLGPNNELPAGELRLRVTGAPAIDAAASIGFIFEDASRTSIGLSDYWHVDASDNSLVIPAEKMARLLAKLPRQQVSVMVGVAAGGGEFTFGANFKAIKRAPITPA